MSPWILCKKRMFCVESLAKEGVGVNFAREQSLQNDLWALDIAIEASGVTEDDPAATKGCTTSKSECANGIAVSGSPTSVPMSSGASNHFLDLKNG